MMSRVRGEANNTFLIPQEIEDLPHFKNLHGMNLGKVIFMWFFEITILRPQLQV